MAEWLKTVLNQKDADIDAGWFELFSGVRLKSPVFGLTEKAEPRIISKLSDASVRAGGLVLKNLFGERHA